MSEAESQEVEQISDVLDEAFAEPEEVTEETETAEGEAVVQEDDEVDVVLEGDEEPAPQNKMPRRVKKLLDRNNQLETDMETKGQEDARRIQQLEAQVAQHAVQTPVSSVVMPLPPTEESVNYDAEAFTQAQAKYQSDMQSWMLNHQTNAAQKDAETTAQNQKEVQEKTSLEAHYKRADALKVSNYDDNEAEAVKTLGRDMIKSIAMVLPNSARVINYLGKNKDKALELEMLNKTNPQAGVAKLWELNFNLKEVPRKRSKAPEPESKVEGGGGMSNIEKKMEAAADKGDITLFRKLKKEALAKGIKL
jgi:hypothetical protein